MKINWKLRIKNKTTLAALFAAIVSLVYIILGVLGITPSVTENEVMDILAAILNALTLLGVVVDRRQRQSHGLHIPQLMNNCRGTDPAKCRVGLFFILRSSLSSLRGIAG